MIYNGDCRDLLPNIQADVVVADPPYGMYKAEWDRAIVPVDEWLPTARRIAPVFVFCGVRGVRDYPAPDWMLAWVRLASTQRNGVLRGFNNWEPILAYGIDALANDVISVPNFRDPAGGTHPTVKPVRLMRRLLALSPPGVVVDPFMGSGTTLQAAKESGRRAIGIEINDEYCRLAVARVSQRVLPFGSAES